MALLPLEQVRDGLPGDPTIFPQNLDFTREAILFLRLDRGALASASFLDDRILTPQSQGRWVRFNELAPWMEGAAPQRPLHFIFHSGHVGSTLVSRLLDEAGAFGLREPLPLRVLASAADKPTHGAQLENLLRWFTILWSRGFSDTKTIVLKATSSAQRLAPSLLQHAPNARAIAMNLKAEPYLATLLAGENSHIDLNGHGPERHRRLARLAAAPPAPLVAMSLGEIAALTWLVETLTQADAKQTFGERILQLDFDAFLDDPGGAMRRVCVHFGLTVPDSFFAEAPDSPVLQRYSKAPEHAYTPALRAHILAQSRTTNAAEISRGMAWLEAFARHSPAAAAALSA
jgi:hypothetical protein